MAKEKSSLHSRMVLSMESQSSDPALSLTYFSAGSPGCGKSHTLIQAVQYAAATDWLVFYFPRGAFDYLT